MKQLLIVICIVLSLGLCLVTAGCGGDPDEDGTCHVTYAQGKSQSYPMKRSPCEDFCEENASKVSSCYFTAK